MKSCVTGVVKITLNLPEAMRMAGIRSDAPEKLQKRLADTARKLTQEITPRYVYRVFPLTFTSQGVEMPQAGLILTGETVNIMMHDCDQAALMACTLGANFDAMLRREQARDMSEAFLLDSCGSVWVEAGCNQVETELKQRLPNAYLTDRFSPGYGDLPLNFQKPLCDVLNTQKRLGLSVTNSFLLNPMKSITAIVGIARTPQPARIRGCKYCSMGAECVYRKEGIDCGL